MRRRVRASPQDARLLRVQAGILLLTTFENSYHTKDPLDFSGGIFTIEHIMPQNALASAEWRDALGPDCERIHEELVNTLGNLTLTAYLPPTTRSSRMRPLPRRRRTSRVATIGITW